MTERTKQRAAWCWLMFMKSFRGLIAEKKSTGWEVSKGRLAFWLVMLHCLWVWAGFQNPTHVEVSAGEIEVLWALLGYNGFAKANDSMVAIKNKPVATPAKDQEQNG